MKKNNIESWQIEESFLSDDSPLLQNYYGDLFRYKENFGNEEIKNKIHSKRLNLERNISKQKLIKKEAKNNFIKLKIKLKHELKENIKTEKLSTKTEITSLEESLFVLENYLPIDSFILSKIKNLKVSLKNKTKNTKKTIKSLKETGDSLDIIETKINKLFLEARIFEYNNLAILSLLKNLLLVIKKETKTNEEKIKFYQDFITEEKESLDIFNFHNESLNIFLNNQLTFKEKIIQIKNLNNTFNILEENLIKSINLNEQDFSKYLDQYFIEFILSEENSKDLVESLRKILTQIAKNFNSQPYFKFELNEKEEKIKELLVNIDFLNNNKVNNILEFKKITKEKLINEKLSIKQLYEDNKLIYKNEFFEKKLNEINKFEKSIDDEIVKKAKDNQKTINLIKKESKKEYKNILKEKQNTKISLIPFSFDIFIKKPSSILSFLNYKNRDEKKLLKAEYLNNLGNKLKDKTYDGDYKIKQSQIYNNFAKRDLEIKNYFLDKRVVIKEKLLTEAKGQEKEDKNLLKIFKTERLEKLKKIKIETYLKVKEKQISKEAYKNTITKEKIFYKEDVKEFKLKQPSNKTKYEYFDLKNNYLKKYKENIYDFNQNILNANKNIPIETKKNSSIWLTILAFLLPGSESFFFKNWKKAILLLLVTAFLYILAIPYAFGAFNLQGQGIIGLVRLSWPTGNIIGSHVEYSDARYALIEGVIGLFLLIISIIYILFSALNTFKISRSMESGIRPSSWFATKKSIMNQGFPYAISIPGWIMILFIAIVPVVVSILLAFTNIGFRHNPANGEETNWVGFENFINIFSNPDIFKPLGRVFVWNIVWAVSTTVLVLFIGTVMAITIEKKGIKGKKIFRMIFMLPWAIPAFVMILFYKAIFENTSTGFINTLLLNWGIISSPIDWTTNENYSRVLLILIQGWLGHSYIVLLITGNMKSISGDIYEAASIDGAKKGKQFWTMTAPIITAQIAPLLIGQFMFNFNNFSLIWLFNGGGPAPNTEIFGAGNTDIILSWIFKITFTSGGGTQMESHQAIASAMVILMSIVIVGGAAFGFSRTKAFRRGSEV
ncbi:MAG: ABC transporter permease subunit [Metamycoplasmataceae bacterium]